MPIKRSTNGCDSGTYGTRLDLGHVSHAQVGVPLVEPVQGIVVGAEVFRRPMRANGMGEHAAQGLAIHNAGVDAEADDPSRVLVSISNSLSGRHGELDHVPAVGDPTDIVQLGTGHHVSADEGQRRVALQRRVAADLGGSRPDARRNVASILDTARELGIRDAQAYADGDLSDSSSAEEKCPESEQQPVTRCQAWRSLARTAQDDQLLLEQKILHDHRSHATGATQRRGHDGQVKKGEQEGLHVRDSVGQTSGATQRGLKPGCSEKIGNSRRTGLMYNGADLDGQNGNPGLNGYGYATENTRQTSDGLRATAFVNPGCHSTA